MTSPPATNCLICVSTADFFPAGTPVGIFTAAAAGALRGVEAGVFGAPKLGKENPSFLGGGATTTGTGTSTFLGAPNENENGAFVDSASFFMDVIFLSKEAFSLTAASLSGSSDTRGTTTLSSASDPNRVSKVFKKASPLTAPDLNESVADWKAFILLESPFSSLDMLARNFTFIPTATAGFADDGATLALDVGLDFGSGAGLEFKNPKNPPDGAALLSAAAGAAGFTFTATFGGAGATFFATGTAGAAFDSAFGASEGALEPRKPKNPPEAGAGLEGATGDALTATFDAAAGATLAADAS